MHLVWPHDKRCFCDEDIRGFEFFDDPCFYSIAGMKACIYRLKCSYGVNYIGRKTTLFSGSFHGRQRAMLNKETLKSFDNDGFTASTD